LSVPDPAIPKLSKKAVIIYHSEGSQLVDVQVMVERARKVASDIIVRPVARVILVKVTFQSVQRKLEEIVCVFVLERQPEIVNSEKIKNLAIQDGRTRNSRCFLQK